MRYNIGTTVYLPGILIREVIEAYTLPNGRHFYKLNDGSIRFDDEIETLDEMIARVNAATK